MKMGSLQTRIQKAISYSTSYSYSNIKSPLSKKTSFSDPEKFNGCENVQVWSEKVMPDLKTSRPSYSFYVFL